MAPSLSMRNVAAEIATRHKLTLNDMIGPCRNKKVSRVRQELMFVLWEMDRWTWTQIAAFLGGRDHTTILFGARAHAERNGKTIRSPAGVEKHSVLQNAREKHKKAASARATSLAA